MLININGHQLNLPDILILGAAKSGTTSLAFFLKQHPDVFMPRKEPGFFAYHDREKNEIPSGIRDRQIVDLKEYTDMYARVGK
ncbi:MAG TPA: sulfotransferase, partial [Cryomorphaceae bacterium]|nr:sulfotransferase [Cryomorphaceae bacterium]